MTANFALFYAGDAYSTEQKIMGRQSAGKSFLRGLALANPRAPMYGVGTSPSGAQGLQRQLAQSGHQGAVHWSVLPDFNAAASCGALYFPGPPTRDLAAARNRLNPGAFGLMGLTHTVASKGATDAIADLVLPPFKPWDALICTSTAAHAFVTLLQEDMRHYWAEHTGATRFNPVLTPIIPLGINTADFHVSRDVGAENGTASGHAASQAVARSAMALGEADVAFLFAGRLTFHAKANPAPVYQALQALAATAPRQLVCIEAGVYPNEAIAQSYQAAQRALAPDVRFVWVDGADEAAYRQAWTAADVFLSLSDNIQETFGLTPVEAMAAGLPVVVSDWNGYKDTVRHGVDGFRIPSAAPPPCTGTDLALAHALDLDNYDFYIGRTSLAVVVDPRELRLALNALIEDPLLRRRMGQAGAVRAREQFDWQVVLPQYDTLAQEMAAIRERADQNAERASSWPPREDPFRRFAHFPSATLQGAWAVALEPQALPRLQTLSGLHMSRYGLHETLLPPAHLQQLVDVLAAHGPMTAAALLSTARLNTAPGIRALMWLWKFAVVRVQGPAGPPHS